MLTLGLGSVSFGFASQQFQAEIVESILEVIPNSLIIGGSSNSSIHDNSEDVYISVLLNSVNSNSVLIEQSIRRKIEKKYDPFFVKITNLEIKENEYKHILIKVKIQKIN